jgi:NADPH:quinone reductase
VWLNVFDLGGLKAGDRLLVHGGSSGIGTTAIQIASALGSPVVITAGNADKCQRCTALGAALAIDYNAQDYVEAIESAFGKRSIDVALNMVGGDYVMRDIRLLSQGGRLVMIAARKGSKIEFDYQALTEKDGRMTGSRLRPRPIQEKGRLTAAVRKAVWPLIESGKFKPIIEKTYPLSEIDAAHKHMAGSHIGKILLTL